MTAVLVVPVTLEVKTCVAPRNTVTELGVTVRLMSEGVEGGVGADGEVELPPQPQTPNTVLIVSAKAIR